MQNQNHHVFEDAGLGKAPFRLVGHSQMRGPMPVPGSPGLMTGAPGQPMGTCDYCSTGIADCFNIESADGKQFIVGSTCVNKTYDKGLINDVKREVNRLKTERRHAREDAKIESGLELLKSHREKFESRQHPYQWRADKGESLADYYDFCLNHGGRTSGVWAFNAMKKIISWQVWRLQE